VNKKDWKGDYPGLDERLKKAHPAKRQAGFAQIGIVLLFIVGVVAFFAIHHSMPRIWGEYPGIGQTKIGESLSLVDVPVFNPSIVVERLSGRFQLGDISFAERMISPLGLGKYGTGPKGLGKGFSVTQVRNYERAFMHALYNRYVRPCYYFVSRCLSGIFYFEVNERDVFLVRSGRINRGPVPNTNTVRENISLKLLSGSDSSSNKQANCEYPDYSGKKGHSDIGSYINYFESQILWCLFFAVFGLALVWWGWLRINDNRNISGFTLIGSGGIVVIGSLMILAVGI
jgi:hypothetical protein